MQHDSNTAISPVCGGRLLLLSRDESGHAARRRRCPRRAAAAGLRRILPLLLMRCGRLLFCRLALLIATFRLLLPCWRVAVLGRRVVKVRITCMLLLRRRWVLIVCIRLSRRQRRRPPLV